MIVFGICSSINGSSKSVYSFDERFYQTLNTIDSIRKYVNDSHIILCENSEIGIREESILINKVDSYIKTNYNHCNKSYNESFQMVKIIESMCDISYDLFFKISGRYYLNENFKIENFKGVSFREFVVSGIPCYSTVLYSFGKESELEMSRVYKNFALGGYSDIENGIYNLLNVNVNKMDILGVSGNIAPSGEYLEH